MTLFTGLGLVPPDPVTTTEGGTTEPAPTGGGQGLILAGVGVGVIPPLSSGLCKSSGAPSSALGTLTLPATNAAGWRGP
jgi:hypothetical protein